MFCSCNGPGTVVGVALSQIQWDYTFISPTEATAPGGVFFESLRGTNRRRYIRASCFYLRASYFFLRASLASLFFLFKTKTPPGCLRFTLFLNCPGISNGERDGAWCS